MTEVGPSILTLEAVILLIIFALTCIYMLLIIFIRRFHTVINILTGNVCLTTSLGCIFWIFYFVSMAFYPAILMRDTLLCSLIPYLQAMTNSLIVYAILMTTINRYFVVMYPNKRLFKRRTFSFISSGVQWIVAIILPLPHFAFLAQVNTP
jgi:hypothetical protein